MSFEVIQKENDQIRYELIYARRKTVGISIDAKGVVTVRAPLRTKKAMIHEIVLKKADWIIAVQKRCQENQAKRLEKEFKTGTVIPFLGSFYELQIRASIDSAPDRIWKEGEQIIIKASNLEQSYIKYCLEAFYRKEAKKVFEQKVSNLAAKMGVWYGKITIKNQKTRWGSCSSKGNLNFNWRILMAPEKIVDYLVVHELAHRLEMNHSKAFYQLVERYFPEYQNAQMWLKENGKNLTL